MNEVQARELISGRLNISIRCVSACSLSFWCSLKLLGSTGAPKDRWMVDLILSFLHAYRPSVCWLEVGYNGLERIVAFEDDNGSWQSFSVICPGFEQPRSQIDQRDQKLQLRRLLCRSGLELRHKMMLFQFLKPLLILYVSFRSFALPKTVLVIVKDSLLFMDQCGFSVIPDAIRCGA